MSDDLLSRLDAGRRRDVRPRVLAHEPGELFIRGPLPWAWLAAASRASGSALRVALALLLEQGFRDSSTVVLSTARLRELGVSRQAAYRAIDMLAHRGLVEVLERRRGKRTTVRLVRQRSTGGDR